MITSLATRKSNAAVRRGRVFASTLLFLCAAVLGGAAAGEAACRGDAEKAAAGIAAAPSGWLGRLGSAAIGPSTPPADADIEETCRSLEPYFGCTIDTIVVRGNTHTKAIAILREMATKQGGSLDERLVRRDAAYLRGLGYFADVDVDAEQSGPGRCRIVVSVIDRPGLFMRFPYPVVNYDFEKGVSYGFTWKVKNFRGNAENLSLSILRRQDKEQGAGFSWSNPWFTGRRIRFRFDTGAYRRLEEPGDSDEEYIRERVVTSLGLGIPISRSLVKQLWLQSSLSFEARDSRRSHPALGGDGTAEFCRQNFVILGGEIEFDSRSDRLSPFDGTLAQFSVRRFSSVYGLDEGYIFYGTANYFYIPVGVERSLIVAVRSNVREGDLPSFFDMRLGGVRDVRGFSDDDLRGRVKLLGTLQYRARIIGPRILRIPKIGEFDIAFNGTVFFDTGTLAMSVLDLDRSVYHSTVGLGLEMISPLRDLMRLEVASDGTGTPAFYLTAGTDF